MEPVLLSPGLRHMNPMATFRHCFCIEIVIVSHTFVLFVRFEFFTAVAMNNIVYWDKEPSSYLTGDTLRLRYRAQPVNAM
jgi:hypothetical protein